MSPQEFQEWKQYAENLRGFGHDRAYILGQMTTAKCSEPDANKVLDGLFGTAEPERVDRESTPSEIVDAVIEDTKPVTPANPILQAALRCVEKGWYVFALQERGKQPDSELSPHGFNSSTNKLDDVRAIWQKRPNANYGIDLGRSNLTVLDFDTGMPSGLQLPNTLQVSTSRGVHVYFQGVSKQGNMHVGGKHVGEIKSAGGYVLGPQCAHPSGAIYTPIMIAPVVTTPSLDQFRVKGEKETSRNERGKVPHGSVHGWLLTTAGKLRAQGLTQDEIEPILLRKAHEECEEPLDDEKICQMAKSICNYKPGEDKSIILNQEPTPSAQSTTVEDGPDVVAENGITYAIIPYGKGFRKVALDTSVTCARPVFPYYVMTGTSIYENLVRPAVETSSKYAEFIFMPAVQAVMNYLSHKVVVEMQPTNMNIFLGLISPYGQYFKSTSCLLAQDYIKAMGLLRIRAEDKDNANGKIVIAQAGSSEGFGLLMKGLNAKTAILFNDELGKLVAKAGIENSSFSSDLLQWHGSALFENSVKRKEHTFGFEAGTYTFGWLWCTTDRNFNSYWPRLAGKSSGIKDRMFFLVSPEKPRPLIPFRDPDLSGAKVTRELVDRAVVQRRFKIDDPMFKEHIAGIDEPRSLDLLFKLALYFAVDLGLTVVDDDCMERARALVDYRNQAAKFLEPIEAENQEGRLMMEILRELRQNGGRMSYRDLCRDMEYNRCGRLWEIAYGLLEKRGDIVYFQEQRTLGKRKTGMVGLVLRDPDE